MNEPKRISKLLDMARREPRRIPPWEDIGGLSSAAARFRMGWRALGGIKLAAGCSRRCTCPQARRRELTVPKHL